jgi:hypothetical protein
MFSLSGAIDMSDIRKYCAIEYLLVATGVLILHLLVPVGVKLVYFNASRWYPSHRNADSPPIGKDQCENRVQVLRSC